MSRMHSFRLFMCLASALSLNSVSVLADSSNTSEHKKQGHHLQHPHHKTFMERLGSFIDFGDPLYIKHHYPYFYENITHLSPKSSANKDRCFKGICFSGLANFDLQYFDRKGQDQPGSILGVGVRPMFNIHSRQLIGSINNIDLFIDTGINRWATMHFDLAYVNASIKSDTYSYMDKDWNGVYQNGAALKINQAYILVADPAIAPVFFQIGRLYANFGDYKPFPINESLTQLLSEMRTGGVMGGVILANGLYATASWTMEEQSLRSIDPNTPLFDKLPNYYDYTRNLGGKIGFSGAVADFCINANVSYIYNIASTNYIAGGFVEFNKDFKANAPIWQQLSLNQYILLERVPGLALHGDVRYDRFALGGDFVTALGNLNPGDVNGHIRAWNFDASVDFAPFNFPTTMAISYQGSDHADIFNTIVSCLEATCPVGPFGVTTIGTILPQTRYQASISTQVLSNMSVALQGLRDQDYGRSVGGTGRYSNFITLRVSASM